MTYKAPYLDASGIHTPEYADILAHLTASYQTIFGADIYLGADAQDYQMLSLFARAYSDAMSGLRESYTSRSPAYASGTALDMLLPLNGITRNEATASEAVLRLTGLANASLPENLLVRDAKGYTWRIPARITLDNQGKATATAYCQTPGAVRAAAGEINEMLTPQAFWYSVTNPNPAIPGADAESDAQVRIRRENAVALPSRSILEGVKAALMNVPGIRRIAVYENKTGAADENGIPGHSLCAVCEDGADADIGKALYLKKSPGCGLYGTTQTTLMDSYGEAVAVSFMRPAAAEIHVNITLIPLEGWDEDRLTPIREAVAAYAAQVPIGGRYVVSYLWPLIFAAAGISPPLFSIKAVTASIGSGGPPHGDSIALSFNQAAHCAVENIRITLEGQG